MIKDLRMLRGDANRNITRTGKILTCARVERRPTCFGMLDNSLFAC